MSVVSVGSGVIVYYTVHYMTESASVLSTFEEDGTLQKFRYVIDGMMANRTMFVAVISFAVTLLIVYFIRRLRVDCDDYWCTCQYFDTAVWRFNVQHKSFYSRSNNRKRYISIISKSIGVFCFQC